MKTNKIGTWTEKRPVLWELILHCVIICFEMATLLGWLGPGPASLIAPTSFIHHPSLIQRPSFTHRSTQSLIALTPIIEH